MDYKWLWKAAIRIAISLLGAGVFYAIILAVFLLLIVDFHGTIVEIILWLSTPVVTAAGFAVGLLGAERLTKAERAGFLRVFVWPLVGCAIGAGAVYWFGPMLIVFGMFALGTASVVLREVVLHIQETRVA